MHPYRPLYILDERAHAKDPCDREEHALVVLLVVLGLARLVPALCAREAFGAEATLALLMLVTGLALTGRRSWKRRV